MIDFKNGYVRRCVTGAKMMLLAGGVSIVVASSGCYQRTIAPEISYDQVQVDRINAEIGKFDWEE